MKRELLKTALLVVILLTACSALAQNTELAVTLGGYIPVNTPVDVDPSFAIEGNIARRIGGVPFVSAYIELPVVASFNSKLTAFRLAGGAIGPTTAAEDYSALFIAPGLKIKFGSVFPVSPWFAFGGGLGRFSKSVSGASGIEETTNTGVFAIGGGIDFKIAPFLGFRTEVRDFYSGSPRLTLQTLDQRQHNIFAGGGLVLRF